VISPQVQIPPTPILPPADRSRRHRLLRASTTALLSLSVVTRALEAPSSAPSSSPPKPAGLSELMNYDLETLLNMEVTSVARKGQRLEDATAAISVITSEDIRRSGTTTIADSLRLVPGMNVAQIEANRWAVSARGFNGPFATKLLVLIDGRSVYSPMFSGVYWEVQDTLLEDLDRIEVIRGPGSTVWGANAVNGVVNIISKPTKETLGTLITASAGDNEQGVGGVRYGGQLGEHASYRVSAKSFYRDGGALPSGADADEDWNVNRGGFRVDWDVSDSNQWTVQGDYYDGKVREEYPINGLTLERTRLRTDVAGINVLTRFKHTWSEDSDLSIQVYYDQSERRQTRALNFSQTEDTFDFEAIHRFVPLNAHEVTWGLGYRQILDDIDEGFYVRRGIHEQTREVWSAFLEDEIRIVEDRLKLTLGSKIEHNTYTGFEYQPTSRLLFTPAKHHTLWAAVSRAVRTPSAFERDSRITIGNAPAIPPLVPPYKLQVLGSESFDSENLLAYELGYRVQPHATVTVDTSIFFNRYDSLRSFYLPNRKLSPTGITDELLINNERDGETYGAEVSATWKPTELWALTASHAWLKYHTWTHVPSSPDEPSLVSPENQTSIRSRLNLPHNVEFDVLGYYVDALSNQNVKSYTRLDLRLGWHPSKQWELSLVVQNLIDDRHPEFAPSYSVGGTEIERSIYGKVTVRF